VDVTGNEEKADGKEEEDNTQTDTQSNQFFQRTFPLSAQNGMRAKVREWRRRTRDADRFTGAVIQSGDAQYEYGMCRVCYKATFTPTPHKNRM
jgi:hypothetical protein